MNLHLSDWEWLRVVTSLLFIWRGIQDLRDRSGTAWKTEDERKNFRKFSGVTLILGGAAFLFNTILPDIEPWNIILLVAAYLACIGFDRSGTTRIGKYILNHSFMIPGLIGVFAGCCMGYFLAHLLL